MSIFPPCAYLVAVDRKVAFVLTELGLTYESVYLDFNKLEQKEPEYTKHNPNGRIPTLIDHKNNDFTVWFVALYRISVRVR